MVINNIVDKAFTLVKVIVFKFIKLKNIGYIIYAIILMTFKDTIIIAITINLIIINKLITIIKIIITTSFKLIFNIMPYTTNIIKDFFTSFINNITIIVKETFIKVVIKPFTLIFFIS